MIKRFTQFITERLGAPDATKDYVDFILPICYDELDKYMARNGQFANYNVKYNFTYSDFKDHIPYESFQKFPISVLDLTFKINVLKGIEKPIQRIGMFYQQPDEPTHYVLEVGLGIPDKANSLERDRCRELLKRVCTHEFTHAYEDVYNKKKEDYMLSLFSYNLLDTKVASESNAIYRIFYSIYFINKTEIRAVISEADPETYKAIQSELKTLREFNTDKVVRKAKKTIIHNKSPEYWEKIYNGFGKIIFDN